MQNGDTTTSLVMATQNLEQSTRVMDSVVRSLCERITTEKDSESVNKDIRSDAAALSVAWNRLREEMQEITETIDYASSLTTKGTLAEMAYILRPLERVG